MDHSITVNLSFLSSTPTGISNYALNIIPALESLSPLLLTSIKIDGYSDENHHTVSRYMSTDCGKLGHVRRLLWLQFGAQKILRAAAQGLLFTPLPEAPIYSQCDYVATIHDIIPLRFPESSALLNLYFRYYVPSVVRGAKHLICNSKTTAEDIIKTYDVPAGRVTPIHLGYDDHKFQPLGKAVKNYFLYVGRHSPHKNLMRLIRAFGQMQGADLELWMAGLDNNRYTPQLRSCVAELGLDHRVRFLGYVPDAELPTLINQALAFVFPSLWEGFGLPILEAMACGTPVISSNCASMAEVAGDAALLVDPHDVGALAQAMHRIACESTLRQDLQRRGLARVKAFSWHKTGAATAEVLKACC